MIPVDFSWTPLFWFGVAAVLGVLARAFNEGVYRSYRGLIATLLMLASILCITVSILNPTITNTERKRTLQGVIDISESMEGGDADELIGRLKQYNPESFRAFAKEVSPIFTGASSLSEIRAINRGISTSRSELSKALEVSHGAPIILVSDGWITGSREEELLSITRTNGTPIFPLIPENAERKKSPVLEVSNLNIPFQAQAKTSVTIRTAVKNETEQPKQGTLVIRDGGKPIFEKSVIVPPLEEVPFSAKSNGEQEGLHKVEVVFTPDDTTFLPSQRSALINSQKRERILLLNGSAQEGATLQRLLNSQAYDLTSLTIGAETVPSFGDFSAVILNNVSAKSLGTARLDSLIPFIERGGGLIMIGGNQSFGLGGYRGSVLEPYLPVTLVPPRVAQKKLNAAVALVIDKSNSMGELRKLDYAKEAAEEVVRNLKDDDYLGVIGFDQLPFVVVKMNQLRVNRAQALDRIKFLYPKLGTNLVPAMDEARRQLARAQAGRKHIIVLTDGMLRANQDFLIQMSEELRSEGVTTSTVLVGLYQDNTMQEMARMGGGTYHQTNDPTALPRIFLSDIKVNAGERTLRETSDYGVFRKDITSPITSAPTFPPIQGFVETAPKEGASLEISIAAEEGERPLLASWTRGKGRVIALTTDASGRWTSEWVKWPKFAQFWTDLISAARGDSATDTEIRYDLSVNQRYGIVELDVALYTDKAAREFTAKVNGAPLVFETVTPGHLQAILRDPIAGTHTFQPSVGTKSLPESSFEVDASLIGEQIGHGFNTLLLKRLAESSGGLVNPSQAYLNQLSTEKVSSQSLSPFLLFSALALLLSSFAIRWWDTVKR
jgi:uncharacterized membrane protein